MNTRFKKGQTPWNKGKGKTVRLNCKCCGKSFDVKEGRKDSAKYCSNKCVGLSIRGRISPMKGKPHTPEAKRKISLSLIGNWRGLGNKNRRCKHQSPETIEKMRLAHLGKHRSLETRKKMSIAMKRIRHAGNFKKGFIPWNKGLPCSEGERKRLKEMRAKQVMPMQDTTIEIKIQSFLKELGLAFIPHYYIWNIEHTYRCDIFIPLFNIVIECDGDYFHAHPDKIADDKLTEKQKAQITRDFLRTKELNEAGYHVLRLWERDIKSMDINLFVKELYTKC